MKQILLLLLLVPLLNIAQTQSVNLDKSFQGKYYAYKWSLDKGQSWVVSKQIVGIFKHHTMSEQSIMPTRGVSLEYWSTLAVLVNGIGHVYINVEKDDMIIIALLPGDLYLLQYVKKDIEISRYLCTKEEIK